MTFKGPQSQVRLSDADRSTAMSALGRALAEGRLDMVEYDERCRTAAAAQVRSELDALFTDLPRSVFAEPAAGGSSAVERVYSAGEIQQARRRGRRPRLALMSLTTVLGITGFGLLVDSFAPAAVLCLVAIPVVFIALYIAKIGPDSWYTPSPQQLERARIREIRAAERMRAIESSAARRRQRAELHDQAMGFVGDVLGSRRRR